MNNELNKILYGFDDLFQLLIKLNNNSKLPSKFIISAKKALVNAHFISFNKFFI